MLFSIRIVRETDGRSIHVRGAVEQVVLVPLVPGVICVVIRIGIRKVKPRARSFARDKSAFGRLE